MRMIRSILATSLLGSSLFLIGWGSGEHEEHGDADHHGDDGNHDDDIFTIRSPAFDSGSAIPDENTCNGKPFGSGTSPKLHWDNPPKHTKSFAIVFKDTSLTTLNPPDNRGWHWAIWDIPRQVDTLPAALASTEFLASPPVARQWSRYSPYGYLGPCPNFDPVNNPVHTDTYSFTLYALDVKILDYPPPDPTIPNYTRVLDEFLSTHAIGKAELIGTSDAIPSAPPVTPDPPPAPSPRP